jgi:MYXO-CTERM domain-containing protein
MRIGFSKSLLLGLVGAGLFSIPGYAAGSAELPADHKARRAQVVDNAYGVRPVGLTFPVRRDPERHAIYAAGDAPLPIFLNRWGGTYYFGDDDSANNVSSIVSGYSSDLSAFGGSEDDWDEVKTCVSDLFARFNVYVTDVEPTGGHYIEAAVGGYPDELDMPWGVAGVAPWDPYGCQIIPNAVVYIFSEMYAGASDANRMICETAAQEIAHAMTLDHAYLCEDPMTYLNGCGEKTFQDIESSCGEYEPRACNCERPTQNSVRLLYDLLGPADGTTAPPPPDDNGPPIIAEIQPEDGAGMTSNSVIEVSAKVTDDVGVVSVELVWDFSDESFPCPMSGGAVDCSKNGDTYTWEINVGEGSRPFTVRARDVVGNVTESEKRTIWLSETGTEEMPDDSMNPEVEIVSPFAGQTFESDNTVRVIATAVDDSGIARADLHWSRNDMVFPCPMDTGYVQCEQIGSTYLWTLVVGEGEREFFVRAMDLVGNTTDSNTININMGNVSDFANITDDAFEDNDTFDLATPLNCEQAVGGVLVRGDDDVFIVDVPKGRALKASVRSDSALAAQLLIATGPFSADVLVSEEAELGDLSASGDPDGGPAVVRLRATSKGSADYRLTVQCVEEKDPNKDKEGGEGGLPLLGDGCAQSSAAGTWPWVLAGLLLFRVRRRRRA